MTDTKQNILHTLAYFDIFHYPLLKEELLRFHVKQIEPSLLDLAIDDLLAEHHIFKLGEFYSLHNDNILAGNRKKGNQLAAIQMQTAYKAARILSKFPYVKGLAISGSLSKNYSTEESDIDFFIITTANRLWIARTIMHFYKKLSFLTGKEKWFCMNYYVDEASLEIEEKNVFTAIEIATLLPMQGRSALNTFMVANEWVKAHFPSGANDTGEVPEMKKGLLGKLTEKLFNNRFGNWLDDRLMRITKKRWQKKEQQQVKNDHGFVMAMEVGKHYSKPNPVFFQHKVIEMYKHKLNDLPKLKHTAFKVV